MSTTASPSTPKRAGVLLNKGELADALGRDRRFVTAMCSYGFKLALGGHTTLPEAMTWLKDNPTFPGIQRRRSAK